MNKTHPSYQRIILYDGFCNLCNWWVQFIIRHDKQQQFVFAAQQSSIAETLLKQFAKAPTDSNSVLLIENGQLYTQSTAALRIVKRLSGIWPCLYAGMLLPAAVRDKMYQFIAKNRYRWFCKQSSCILPNPQWKHLFIDQ